MEKILKVCENGLESIFNMTQSLFYKEVKIDYNKVLNDDSFSLSKVLILVVKTSIIEVLMNPKDIDYNELGQQVASLGRIDEKLNNKISSILSSYENIVKDASKILFEVATLMESGYTKEQIRDIIMESEHDKIKLLNIEVNN